MESVADSGVLDHVLAKLLPVVTTLRVHSKSATDEPESQPADFPVTDKFAPAQKNETQLRFHKVKSTEKKTTKFPLKYVLVQCV